MESRRSFVKKSALAGTGIIVAPTIISPSTKKVFDQFKSKYPNTELITYDSFSVSALLEANNLCFGKPYIPSYHVEKADLVVSFGADFLGSWISPVEFSKQLIVGIDVLTYRCLYIYTPSTIFIITQPF